MLAVVAMICFILALFKVDPGFSLLLLGLVFLAADLAFGAWIPYGRRVP